MADPNLRKSLVAEACGELVLAVRSPDDPERIACELRCELPKGHEGWSHEHKVTQAESDAMKAVAQDG